MRVLILFLLSSPVFAATPYESPAAFTNFTCEQYLLGEPGKAKAADALEWLNELHPMTLMVQQWHGASEVPDHVTARGVFFDEMPPGTTLEEVMHRFDNAKREMDRLRQAPTGSLVASRDLSERPMLDADQLLALGFRSDELLSSVGLAASMSKETGALLFHVVSTGDEGQETDFRLNFDSMTTGFDNMVSSWQATKLDSQTTPPVRAFDSGGEDRWLREFMAAHGRFLLMRRVAGQKFAYAFDRSMLKRSSGVSSNFDLTIYRVIECDRPRVLKESPIITPRRSTGRYQCFIPLNLRMAVPIEGFETVFSNLYRSRQAL